MPGKGQHHILYAIDVVDREGFKVKLRLAGNYDHKGKYFRRLKDYVDKNNLNDVVEFLGHVEDMEALYKSADVVINFSESEAFPRVCLEPQGYGIPVISSDCGGPREIIEDGRTGFIVPNKNAKDLAKAIMRINDIETRRKMSVSARSLIRSRFGAEQTTEKLKSLYLELLSSSTNR
jgi:glycosyltransferase involved in cell wall biosynthesis